MAGLRTRRRFERQLDNGAEQARARINPGFVRAAIVKLPMDDGTRANLDVLADQVHIAQDLARVQIDAQVDEADIGQVARDNDVSFTVDAYPDVTFKGKVEQVRLAPITLTNVVTYTVVIAADNTLGDARMPLLSVQAAAPRELIEPALV